MPVAYFLLWLILNGKVNLEVVLVGLAVSGALWFLSAKLSGRTLMTEWKGVKRIPAYALYMVILVKEIFASSFRVMKLILSGREPNPALVMFHTRIREDGNRILYANSITLTPGTITAMLSDGRYRVHALDKSFLTGITNNAQTKLLERTEARDNG